MAFKETKRKGFNFFRSYYDVYNELETDEDKLSFINALLDRQFLGVKPTGLKGLAKFAWISQVNSIDSQVKGYQDKTKTILDPTEGGGVRGKNTPTLQVQVEVEVEGEVKEKDNILDFEKFTSWFNTRRTQYLEIPSNIKRLTHSEKTTLSLLKKDYTKEDFEKAMYNLCNDDWANKNSQVLCSYFLQTKIFNKFLSIDKKPMLTKKQRTLRGGVI